MHADARKMYTRDVRWNPPSCKWRTKIRGSYVTAKRKGEIQFICNMQYLVDFTNILLIKVNFDFCHSFNYFVHNSPFFEKKYFYKNIYPFIILRIKFLSCCKFWITIYLEKLFGPVVFDKNINMWKYFKTTGDQ